MRTLIALTLAVVAQWVAPAFAQAPDRKPALELVNEDIRFTVTKGSDMRLELRGVPVFREQSVFIIKPGWTGVYLYQDEATPTKCEAVSATEGVTEFETDDAFARYRFTLEKDAFTMRLEYGPKVAPPVTAQVHTYLNANLFSGAAYSTAGGQSGRIPPAPLDPDSNRLLEDAADVTYQTVLGPVRVTVEGDSGPFHLDDYRAGQAEWARKNPMMWLGANVNDFPAAGRTMTMTFRFQPPAAPPVGEAAEVKTAVTPTKQARIPWVPDTPVIPRPKQAEYDPSKEPFRLDATVNLIIPKNPAPEERQAALEMQSELKDLWGVASAIHERDLSAWEPIPKYRNIILARMMAVENDDAGLNAFEEILPHPEGYAVITAADNVGVLGADARGVYNGAQTLKQLLRADAGGVYFKPVLIRDWPTLAMRGVHWFGGRNSRPFHTKMIERIAAPFKLNTMLYEVDYADWDILKSHDAARGMSKADVKATVDLARKHFLEPIPEIETFGNSDWLFVNGQNEDIRWKGRERSYDPNNPKSFDLVFGAFQEAIDLFQPKYFHIGHDEMTVGDKAIPPPGEPKSAVDLIAESVEKLSGWLRARNLTTMMWGDTALFYPDEAADAGTAKSSEDARALRAKLPRDVVIADWHYDGDTTAYPSINTFQGLGHKVVGCTWFDRNNIRNFAKALARDKSLGMIQTTWAGWIMDEEIVKGKNAFQLIAYVLAAEHAWSGGQHSMEELGWEPEEIFARAWERAPVDRSIRPGFTVSVAPSGESKPAPMAGIAMDAREEITLAGGLETAGRPGSVSLPLGGRKASRLHFLWRATVPTDIGTTVATLTVRYEDGETVDVPIAYGRAIFAPSDPRASKETVTVDRETGPDGPTSRRLWAWTNPRPEAPIAALTLASARTEAAPILSAVTGVE